MQNNCNSTKKKSRCIAFSGVMSACAVVALLLGSYLVSAAYGCLAASSLLIGIVREECGARYAAVAYAAVAILSLLFVPYKKIVWLFILLVGYYPLLKPLIDRFPSLWLRIPIKVLLCSCMAGIVFWGTAKLIYSEGLTPELNLQGVVAVALFVLAGNVAFLLYDYAMKKLLKFFREKISVRLKNLMHG